MARIPETELERLKAEVSVERLVEAAGIELTKNGKDRLGKCPFHEDREASLVVTPSKNLWHCFGCGVGGGPIDWVMKAQGISFRHAVELLRADIGLPAQASAPAKESRVRHLPPPVAFDVDDKALLRQVIDYYHEALKTSPEALDYLKARGIHDPEAIERFKLGYANRTLGYGLPVKQVKAGAEIRGRLQKVGLYRESGHEHFTGCLVIPILDEEGNVTEVYGRRTRNDLRSGMSTHLYLPGPHKGIWNVAALKESKEIILCEALFDALTFWVAGFRNVTSAYGAEGFTPDHLEAFAKYGTERVLIAFDRDGGGDRGAEKVARTLIGKGIDCYRIEFPKGMDANAYALKVQPAAKSLELVIRNAVRMGGDRPPEGGPDSGPGPAPPQDPPSPEAGRMPEGPKAAKEETTPGIPEGTGALQKPTIPEAVFPLAAAPQAAVPPVPPPLGDDLPHEFQGLDLMLRLEDRVYRVRGWEKPLSPEVLKVNLMVTKDPVQALGSFHVDTLDLYQAKARTAFIRQACQELAESEESLKLDLGRILRKVEALQADALAEALAAKAKLPPITETEHAEALALLKAPDLMARILADFEALGVVGEESNKLTGYLASVSRLLDRPLALLIQSASAAGKSSLMDAVLDLIPEEDVVRYSAMSGQSVFYMGDKGLCHKILAIAEEEGAKQASYALKLLQSEGRVTMASTGKNPTTGMLETHDYTVEGPVALFLTSTAIDLDEELLNRCLVLSVNESREQTRAIHALQRSRETLEGLLAKAGREDLLKRHRNAQRLLQPLAVVNPYAHQLGFRDDQTRSRRDHMKYLTLIRAIALLHQFQREVRTHGELRYIEVQTSDIALANALAQEVFARTVDDLLPQTRKLLTLLHGWVKAACEAQSVPQHEFQFTRRQAREAIGWGDTQMKIHLARLVEMEFLRPHRDGHKQPFVYELLYQGEEAGGCLGLIEVQDLDATACGRGEEAMRSGCGRGTVGLQSAIGRGAVGVAEANGDKPLNGFHRPGPENAHRGILVSVASYPDEAAR